MVNKIGDSVCVLGIKNADRTLSLIHAKDRGDFDESDITEHKVQIVGSHQMREGQFICLVDWDPHSYFSFKIRDQHVKAYDVDRKFLNNKGAYINNAMIWVTPPAMVKQQIHSRDPGGSWCMICPKFIQYAEPNLNNGAFVCRSCRLTKMYKVRPYLRSVNIDPNDVDWIKA
jgi:hypothetical protein